ncbi:hypothetical protein ANN_03156 [Periplaneta americana]|uniref:Uncharacterized protein n=1 Tax=Periplaneta americana TaxID=6978 RepID=A0ABQ8TZW8_PERAM|nr:hypothetical protein ANN_03156 [Periplaneta americana]
MKVDSKAQKKRQKKGNVKKNNNFTPDPTADLVAKEKQVNCKSTTKKSVGMSLEIKIKSQRSYSSSSSSDISDADCLHCGYLYSESTEGWIQCWKCHKWAHCSCAGEEDEDDEAVHLCALC